MIRVLLLLALGAALAGQPRLARAAAPVAAQASFKVLYDQGLHYFKLRKYPPAQVALEQAAATAEGKQHYGCQRTLALTYLRQLILEKAFPAARRAAEVAKRDKQEEAQDLVNELETQYGGVTLIQDPDQKTTLKQTYVRLKDVGGLINLQKKQIFTQLQERFARNAVKLPITIYLPFGSYTANGAPFEAKQGDVAQAKLFMYLDAVEQRSNKWLYVGIAGAAVVGAAAVVTVLLLPGDEQEQTFRLGSVSFLDEQ